MATIFTPRTEKLPRPGGSIAFDVTGQGPLVVLVPGMGDLRSTYRHIVPALLGAGYRVATTDLRGHGDSDATFTEYGDEPTAQDLAALIRHLGGPAAIAGNSMAAGAAVLLAAQSPELVRGLVLIGPFVRTTASNPARALLMRILMYRGWAATSWKSYLPRMYAGARPADHAEHVGKVIASIRRPGYGRAFSLTTRVRHDAAERALGRVRAPALVIMGSRDPDFPDPAAEAGWIASQVHGETLIVPDAGHYPQAQQPATVSAAMISFLARSGAPTR